MELVTSPDRAEKMDSGEETLSLSFWLLQRNIDDPCYSLLKVDSTHLGRPAAFPGTFS